MKAVREDEVSCSISTISSSPSFCPPDGISLVSKGLGGICRNLFEPTNNLFWWEPRTLIGDCTFLAANSKYYRNTQLRHFTPSPNRPIIYYQ